MLASTLSFSPGDARGDEEVRWTDNLFVDGGGGFEDYPFADDAQGFGWLGFNWGMPITRRDDGAAVLGAQVGGDVKLGEEDPEWNATAGLFGRGLPGVASSTDQSAAALLVDYQRTYVGNDLLALRPIVGTSAGDAGSFGATASIGLNEEEEDGIEEESVDRVGGFWNRPFGESVVGELIVGYQLGRVDEMYFQPTLAVSLTENADVGAGAQVNAAGDYAATFGFSYHFGGTRRHEWIHNVPGRGTTLYTPFPKQPLANFLQDAKRPAAPGSGTGIIGDPAVTPTNTASTSDDDSPPGAGGAGGAGGTGAPGGLGGAGGAGGTGGTGGVGGAGGAGPGGGSGGIGGGAGGSVGGGGGSGGGGADPGDDDGQGCNRGVGNGPEGCDPGNSSGKPGNAGEPRG